MAGNYVDINIRQRNHQHRSMGTIKPTAPSQVEKTNQVVTNSGAAVAIRPPKTALRRMDTRGAGSVSYY